MKIDERLSPRSRLLLFQTLELVRKEIQPRFFDWKDADDWLFSQLDFTKDELAQIYKGRDTLYYDASAVDLDAAKLAGQRQSSIERLIGRPIFSDEARVVIDELKVMLGVDALDINQGFDTDAEREDMIRYVERIIHEYHLEESERNLKDGFHEYLNAAIPLNKIQFADNQDNLHDEQKLVEQEVYALLGNLTDEYDVQSPYYKEAVQKMDAFCEKHFPVLSEIALGTFDFDLIFSDGNGDFEGYYYNPDSNAGGQIVKYTFDNEQLSRIVAGEEHYDVIAENTQYLSDINSIHFFNTLFEIVDRHEGGRFLGVMASQEDLKDLCKDYLNRTADIPPLDEQISSANTQLDEKKTWAEQRAEELAQKPRSEWTEDDWSAHNYIANLHAEADYFDGLDDR